MINKTKDSKKMVLIHMVLLLFMFASCNGLIITNYKTNKFGKLLLTVNNIQYSVCVPEGLVKNALLGRVVCMQIGFVGLDGYELSRYILPDQELVQINYECLNICENIDVSKCFNALAVCPSRREFYITCSSKSTTEKPQIPCPKLANITVELINTNMIVLRDGISQWKPSFATHHALLYSKFLCRILGYAHYLSKITKASEYLRVIEMNSSCATPCGNKTIKNCLQFPSTNNKSEVWDVLCYTEKSPQNSSKTVDTCKIAAEITETAEVILPKSEVIWYMKFTDFFTNGLTGYVALITNDNNLYRICVNSSGIQLGLFGPMLCTELGYEPSYDAYWQYDEAPLCISSYIYLNRSCLNNCYGKKIGIRNCLTNAGSCIFGTVLKLACGLRRVTPIKNGNFTCPIFKNGSLSRDVTSLTWTKNSEAWYMCAGVTGRDLLANYACMQMGYLGARRYDDTYHYDQSKVVQLDSTCLPSPCANFSLEQCLSLPPICPTGKAFAVSCYGIQGPAKTIIDTCASTITSLTNTIVQSTTTTPYKGDVIGEIYILVKGVIMIERSIIPWNDDYSNKYSNTYKNSSESICTIIRDACVKNSVEIAVCFAVEFTPGSVISKTELLGSTAPRSQQDSKVIASSILSSINAQATSNPTFALQNVNVVATKPIEIGNIVVFARSTEVVRVHWISLCPECLLTYELQWRLDAGSAIQSSQMTTESSYNVLDLHIPKTAQFRIRSMSRSYLSLYSLWTTAENLVNMPETTPSYITTISPKPSFSVAAIIIIVIIAILLISLLIVLIVLYKCHEGFRRCITCKPAVLSGVKKEDPYEMSNIAEESKSGSEPHYYDMIE